MLTHQQLLKIISGKQKGIVPSLVRCGLSCLTPLYRIGIGWRNRRFDKSVNDHAVVKRAGIPVISVGNLTTGGTGKTPMVIWISNWLRAQHVRVALISRGYTADPTNSTGGNDEALELESRLPDVPHLQDPDRYKMSQIAVGELDSEAIVLDDGFQHRKLWRDLDIVLLDATNPFGYNRLLPRGILREPVTSLARADFAIVTRANLVDSQTVAGIVKRVKKVNSEIPIAVTQTLFSKLLQSDGSQFPIDHLSSFDSTFAFCAIGNPDNFRMSVEATTTQVSGFHAFRDHYEFKREDLELIGEAAKSCGAKAIVCTHKDLVKVGTNRIAGLPVFAILMELEFVSGKELLAEKLQGIVQYASLDQ